MVILITLDFKAALEDRDNKLFGNYGTWLIYLELFSRLSSHICKAEVNWW